MRELVKHGAARIPHTLRIATKIAQHAPTPAAAVAVIVSTLQDVKATKAGRPVGAMLTRLDGMTAADWKQTPATTVVIAREREE